MRCVLASLLSQNARKSGHGSDAHAPDEYYIIESTNPKIQGFDGAVMSFIEYLYELAK